MKISKVVRFEECLITRSIISYQIHTKIFSKVDIFNNRHANTVAFGVRVTKALITIVITWWKWFFFPNYVFCGEGTIIYVMTGSKFMCIQCLLFYPRMQYFMLIKIFYLHLKLDLRKLWLVHILFKSMESFTDIKKYF